MTDPGRVIIVGGGHNGLVCAAYIARAGRRVTVLEAAPHLGGAAVTREFAPGFRVSAAAHLLHLLDPVVVRELRLGDHGFAIARSGLRTVALAEDGAPLVLDGAEVLAGEVSPEDRAALREYHRRVCRFAAVIARQHGRIPPRLASGAWSDALTAGKLALDIRRLGRADMREFLRIVTMNIFDLLEETFRNPALQGALALDGVLGAHLGPRSGNSVFNMLHRLSGTIDGRAGAFALPRGGMGAVSEAIAGAARAAGAEIRVSSPVASLLVDGPRVAGVRLESGEELRADVVVSNADPRTTLLKLLGARHLETEFARRVRHVRMQGNAAKLHLALSSRPEFRALPAEHLGERLLIAPDLAYIERAFNPSKYREFSAQPVLELSVPSIHDPGLAPAGCHVLSAVVQYAPYDIAGGWSAARERLRSAVLAVIELYAPGIASRIVAAELLTPADIEAEFRIAGGHWHHGELALDPLMMLRPVPGAAQYATPVAGLYLCGAGCHPGGGVMGSAGRNAARAVLEGARSP
jgi:phytoene dehydrogenase-like protein